MLDTILADILLAINFSNFSANPIEWSLYAFRVHFGMLVWPIIFTAVIGFTYGITHNLGSVVAVILLTFCLFGTTNYFLQAPEFNLFFSIIAVIGIAGMMLVLFFRRSHPG